MTPELLARISTLLESALELPELEYEAWLSGLSGDDAALAPTLRDLLSRQASQETADLLDRPPAFTVAGPIADSTGQREGDTVGPYRLERALGRGGMGEVWLAARVDGSLKRKVALKLPHITWAPGLAERFAREREILSGLEHPNIARLYDAGVDAQGRPYMALEYVEGQPLDEYCNLRALSIEARLKLLLQVADAMAFAHSRLVVHRDLKPGNMLVTADGQVRLLDFGIAKLMEGDRTRETALTQMSGRALTLDYASPEQIRGEPIGTASDVYSLGVVAFELLAGARPYRLKRGSAAELEEAITGADAPLASNVADSAAAKKLLKGDLDAILNKALKKQVAERYPIIDALAQDMRRHLAGQGVTARPDTIVYRLSRLARRQRAPLAAGLVAIVGFVLALGFGATAVVIVALLLGLGAALWQARVARGQTRIAQTEAKTAEAVQSFLEGVFRANSGDQANPIKARQRTAKQLLDEGAARIANELDDEPLAKLRVLKTLANMYEDMSETEAATVLLRQRHQLAANRIGPNSATAAEALGDLGQTLAEAENLKESQEALDKADAILQRWPDPTGRAEIRRDVGLATLYFRIDPKKGVAPAERALAALRLQAPSLALVEAFLLLGLNLHHAGNLVRAKLALEEGLKSAQSAPGGARSISIELLISLARVTGELDDIDLADQYFARALQLSETDTGVAGLHTLVTMGQRGELLANGGRLREGVELLDKALKLLLSWPDSPDRTAHIPGFTAYSARVLLRVGRPEEALAVADLGLRNFNSETGNPVWPVRLQATRALTLLQLGRDCEAEVAIIAARELIEKAHLEAEWVRLFVLGEVRMLALRGRGVLALEVWREYRRAASLPELPPAHDFAALCELAEFELAADLPGAAFEHTDQGLNALTAHATRAHHAEVESQLHLLRGLALARLQRPAEARAALAEAVRLRETTLEPEQSPELAEARLALAAALLANHETDAARAQWLQARDIVARHAQLGPQYTEPLCELAKRLAPV